VDAVGNVVAPVRVADVAAAKVAVVEPPGPVVLNSTTDS
jgi:hypothetical protein